MKGYKPTYSYTNYDTDSKGLMMDNVPYCNKNGFVWGIKVPVGIATLLKKFYFRQHTRNLKNGWKVMVPRIKIGICIRLPVR